MKLSTLRQIYNATLYDYQQVKSSYWYQLCKQHNLTKQTDEQYAIKYVRSLANLRSLFPHSKISSNAVIKFMSFNSIQIDNLKIQDGLSGIEILNFLSNLAPDYPINDSLLSLWCRRNGWEFRRHCLYRVEQVKMIYKIFCFYLIKKTDGSVDLELQALNVLEN